MVLEAATMSKAFWTSGVKEHAGLGRRFVRNLIA
jgi:hypothetical protein